MLHLGQELAVRGSVTAQAVGHEPPGLVLQASEQAFEEPLSGRGIPPVLDQEDLSGVLCLGRYECC